LLALMLLHHARRAARTAPDGSLVPLAEQDRSRWDTGAIAEGVTILQAALARDRLGEFQAQAAIAALHADATSTGTTDWVQVVEWYDELLRLTPSTPRPPATRPRPRSCTNATAIRRAPRGSTPRRRSRPGTWPNATT
jgi:predicted RNA polymerase sigma factor